MLFVVAAAQVMEQGGGAEQRVAGERQFFLQGEDPCAEGPWVVARQQEDRFELAQFAGPGLHGGVIEGAGVVEYGQAVAGERTLGEHIELPVASGHGPFPVKWNEKREGGLDKQPIGLYVRRQESAWLVLSRPPQRPASLGRFRALTLLRGQHG